MWKAEHFCPKSGPAWEVMGMCKNFFLKKPNRYVKKTSILFISRVLLSETLQDEGHNGIQLDLNIQLTIREPVHYGLLHKMCRSCDWLDFTMFFHWLLKWMLWLLSEHCSRKCKAIVHEEDSVCHKPRTGSFQQNRCKMQPCDSVMLQTAMNVCVLPSFWRAVTWLRLSEPQIWVIKSPFSNRL